MSEMEPWGEGGGVRKERRQVTAPINITCTLMRVHAARLMVTVRTDIFPRVWVNNVWFAGRIMSTKSRNELV